jgi:phosphonate transport system substrate-binding protein
MEGGGLRKKLMVKYLEDQLHMRVEVVSVDGYAPTIEAMRAEKVDFANFGSLSYIIASQKAGAEAIVARGNPDGSIGGYRSAIAVPRDSPIHSIEDLKAHAKDLVFAFSDPASTSGNLYPRVGLMSMGIDPEKDFKKVIFAGTHPETVMAIKAGKVDVGAYQATAADRLIRTKKIAQDDIRVIWTSDLIPNSCYAVRKGLPEQLKKDIQAALIAIPTKDPELAANLLSLYRTSTSGSTWVSVNDATYDGLRHYAAKVKDFKFVEEK